MKVSCFAGVLARNTKIWYLLLRKYEELKCHKNKAYFMYGLLTENTTNIEDLIG